MRHQLRQRPPGGLGPAPVRQALRRQAGGAHGRGLQFHLQRQVEGAGQPVRLALQVGQGAGVAAFDRRAGEGGAKRRQRLHRHHPGRDGAGEVLGQEGAQRLVLPGLHVTRGPVVEQHQAEEVVFGLRQRHALAQRVAGADEGAQLQFVVQPLARAQGGRLGRGRFQLAQRAAYRRATDDKGRGPPVIADGHPLVVGQQRVVRAEQFAHRGGVVDAGVEVGVVADLTGQLHRAVGLRAQAGLQHGLQRAAFGQCRAQPGPQAASGGRAQAHEGVEVTAGQGGQPVAQGVGPGGIRRERPRGRAVGEQRVLHQPQVQHLVTDGDAYAGRAGRVMRRHRRRREAPEGQVLNGEVGVLGVGRIHPAAQRGVVGGVERGGHACSTSGVNSRRWKNSACFGARLVLDQSSSIFHFTSSMRRSMLASSGSGQASSRRWPLGSKK